jgi:TetR/AcrR family transcriptional repressor of nem operon
MGGYSNFSFRELAAEVGIKSASVHYYFRTKGDLGAEIARQYTDNFLLMLGKPNDIVKSGGNPLNAYINQFRLALINDKKMCLCGILGAESNGLPNEVRHETKVFFQRTIDWLEQAYEIIGSNGKDDAKRNAVKMLSVLEGAMLMSIALDDNKIFEQAVSGISGS